MGKEKEEAEDWLRLPGSREEEACCPYCGWSIVDHVHRDPGGFPYWACPEPLRTPMEILADAARGLEEE